MGEGASGRTLARMDTRASEPLTTDHPINHSSPGRGLNAPRAREWCESLCVLEKGGRTQATFPLMNGFNYRLSQSSDSIWANISALAAAERESFFGATDSDTPLVTKAML